MTDSEPAVEIATIMLRRAPRPDVVARLHQVARLVERAGGRLISRQVVALILAVMGEE